MNDLLNNTSKTFSVYKHEEDEKISNLGLNPFCKGKIQGFYKRKTKGGFVLFSVRKKDFYCYSHMLEGDSLAYVNGKEFIILK